MGTINSACQSCFDNKPDLFERDFDLLRHPDKFRTLESTAEDLDRLEEKLLKREESTSLDSIQDKDSAQRKRYQKLSLEDFDLIKTIGHGTYGKVYLVQRKATKKYYTLKVMKKKDLVLKNLLKCVLNERNILQDLKHPFVVSLRTSFQTNTKAYIVTDYCSGGNLGLKLQKEKRFDVQTVRFYAAELVLTLEYLHEKLNIIHRDIKPENILIASDGHIKLADFGLAKSTSNALTLCGTAEYLAPEIIWGRAYGYAVDWWALGCMICEMLTGSTPFYDNDREKLFSNIMTNEPKMNAKLPGSLKNLLSKLLEKNPKLRLGSQGAWEIKQHRFFKDVDWATVLNKELAPPFKEDVAKEEEDNLPSTEFNRMISTDTLPRDSDRTSNYNIDFPRFSYVATDALGEIPEIQQDREECEVRKEPAE